MPEMCFVADYKQLNATDRETEELLFVLAYGLGFELFELIGYVSSLFWMVTMDGNSVTMEF